VGLIAALLTLPLAPVRGAVWLAQIIQAEAESQELDEPSILLALEELELAREAGDFSEEEIEQAEDVLVERLMVLRGVGGQETHGRFE
jgi:hypothetical protein